MELVEVGTAVLTGMLREGVTEKVTFEQGCEGGNRKSRVGICDKRVPGREDSKFKKPTEEACLERIKHGEAKEGLEAMVGPGSARLLHSMIPLSKTGATGGFQAKADVREDRRLPCAHQGGGNSKIQMGDAGLDPDGDSRRGALAGSWVHSEGRVGKISDGCGV